ncbi:hypothetical protein [Nocardioides sp. SYSU DS0651]|uniref:hypothetical protein n=1 Tax=Nocardioides sp. SYSU DS0651 TaxID=3415955 RepID=UPI003F4C7B5F
MPTLTVPRRFNGPPTSGNGGWVAGALAARSPDPGAALTVTLRLPPPLEVPLDVRTGAEASDTGVAVLSHDGRTVAEARPAEQRPIPVAPVGVAEAEAAEASYAGHRSHPFPSCFVCGTAREPGDGLRIFAGPVADGAGPRVAATWTPPESDVPVTWAALDCPSAWASDLEERPLVLGRMTVELHSLPRPEERHVVVGEVRRTDGRKTFTAATLYRPGDEVVAAAEHVWIAIDPAGFR